MWSLKSKACSSWNSRPSVSAQTFSRLCWEHMPLCTTACNCDHADPSHGMEHSCLLTGLTLDLWWLHYQQRSPHMANEGENTDILMNHTETSWMLLGLPHLTKGLMQATLWILLGLEAGEVPICLNFRRVTLLRMCVCVCVCARKPVSVCGVHCGWEIFSALNSQRPTHQPLLGHQHWAHPVCGWPQARTTDRTRKWAFITQVTACHTWLAFNVTYCLRRRGNSNF